MAKQRGKTKTSTNRIAEALAILEVLGVPIVPPTPRRKERMALALLALANIKPSTPWRDAAAWQGPGSWRLGTKEIVEFWHKHYGDPLSRGTYDYVKRDQLNYLVEAGLALESAGKPAASRTSPTRKYAISGRAARVLREFGLDSWETAVSHFLEGLVPLAERMKRVQPQAKVEVRLSDGSPVRLEPGAHNELQKAIVEEFLARFGHGAQVLYLADSSNRRLHIDDAALKELGFFELRDDLLPDVVAYDPRRRWIYLIEAVHSSNPLDFIRHERLRRLTEKCKAPRIYVTVFKDRKSLTKYLAKIDWQTEVWLADDPSHLIHFDGVRFLGPYAPDEGTGDAS